MNEATLVPKAGWVANLPGRPNQLVLDGGTIYASLQYTAAGLPYNVLAIDVATGMVTPYGLADAYVTSLVVNAGTLFIGGAIFSVNGVARNELASIDVATGTLTSWGASAVTLLNTPYALAVGGGVVYVGGEFTLSGVVARRGLAGIDATTGVVTAWNPGTVIDVSALAVAGNTLYVGGTFTQIAGQTRRYLAAFDITTGALLPWNPGAVAAVNVLTVHSGTGYVGGQFGRILAVDAVSGSVAPWNPYAGLSTVSIKSTWAIAVSDTLVVASAYTSAGDGVVFAAPP